MTTATKTRYEQILDEIMGGIEEHLDLFPKRKEEEESRPLHLIPSALGNRFPKLRLQETAPVTPALDTEPRNKYFKIGLEVFPSDCFINFGF